MVLKPTFKINSRITSKNQVTIPKSVREALNINPADSIEWDVDPSGRVIVKKTSGNLWDIVAEQEKEYGNFSTPEINWGNDLESEEFDE